MKYVMYIDYRKVGKIEYLPLNAKAIGEAIVEADEMHNPDTMYLIRLMEKDGKCEKVESDLKAQVYTAFMEKRSSKWAHFEGEHSARHYISKFADWYETL